MGTEESREPVAFCHFRFDMDYDDDVLYCYEIQLEQSMRRKGLGRFLMKVLDLIMMMLTVFKHNQSAYTFFTKVANFTLDETSPVNSIGGQFDYEILSRMNVREQKKREDIENQVSN